MTVCSDIVSDNPSSDICGPDKCGPDKCGSDKCRFDMVPDKVSDNPGSDKHCSDKCALTWSENPSCDEWIPALLGCGGALVEPTSPSEPLGLILRSTESFILWIDEYIVGVSKSAVTSVALASVALKSVTLTSAALTWSLTRSLTRSLTIPALINMPQTSALWHDLTIPAAINVTDKCDNDMDSGTDWLWQGAKGDTGYQASLLRSTYPINVVYHGIWFQRCALVE